MAELVALAKAEPGKLSYGHAGVGTSQHLAAELFKYMAHVDIAPVPYRGTTALMPDLLANRINMSFANIVNVVPLARKGNCARWPSPRSNAWRWRPTCRPWRNPASLDSRLCRGSAACTDRHAENVLDKLHGETVTALAMPEVRKKFDYLGLEPVGNTPAEFTAIIKKETPEWAKVIKDAGIKLGQLGGLPGPTLWKIVDASQFVGLARPRANGLFRRTVSAERRLFTRSIFHSVRST